MEKILVSKEILQKLVSNFYAVCSHCDELDIYEYEDLDKDMQSMKEWTDEIFGRDILKEEYL